MPAIDYNSFNAFQCNYNTSLLKAQAKILYERGLVDTGYNILTLNDYYVMEERNSSRHIVEDLVKFLDGISAFSKDVRSLGIRLTRYSYNGYRTCAGYPGSYGHKTQDLET